MEVNFYDRNAKILSKNYQSCKNSSNNVETAGRVRKKSGSNYCHFSEAVALSLSVILKGVRQGGVMRVAGAWTEVMSN